MTHNDSAPHLVLAGAGHVHVEVLRRLASSPRSRRAFGAVTLVSPEAVMSYSGMLPATVAGHYARDAMEIDVARLAAAADVRCRWTAMTRVDGADRRAALGDETSLTYDLLSLDIGSEPVALPGAQQPHVVWAKPVAALWAGLDRLENSLAGGAAGPAEVAVIGGGAGGVELALSLAYRWRRRSRSARVTLFDSDESMLADHEPAVRRRLGNALAAAGVVLHTGTPIAEIGGDRLIARDGRQFPANGVFLTTGAQPPKAWLAGDLDCDVRGFVRVRWSLASRSHPEVFAAGDIAALPEPRPKSGVFAIRAAPTLAANLERAAAGRELRDFTAQRRALALITLGNRRAVASRGWPFAPTGRLIWRIKDRIDRRFVIRYRVA